MGRLAALHPFLLIYVRFYSNGISKLQKQLFSNPSIRGLKLLFPNDRNRRKKLVRLWNLVIDWIGLLFQLWIQEIEIE